jgi:asparagine synthase (glutamine-hydrolysing)
MSGIAVIYHRDGSPAHPTQLDGIMAALNHRGPDGLKRWFKGPVALGHAMLRTTPESVKETQPLSDESGTLCLTLDGRVDNLEELAAALRATGKRLRCGTDAELVLRAHECWQEESPRRIVGDFAYALWDEKRQRLFCARDSLGIKPLYYYVDDRTFLCCSELQAIRAYLQGPQEPNETFIAEYLWGGLTDRRETLYKQIFRLEPSHYLIVDRDGLTIRQYYDLNPESQITYPDEREYAEHFFDILEQAVRSRMRNITGIAAELSGGLDSSSVVGMSQSLLRAGTVSTSRFETFSTIYSDPRCDERPYIDDVVGMWNLKEHRVDAREPGLSTFADKSHRYRDLAGYPDSVRYEGLRKVVGQCGYQVLLTGAGGDDWLSGSRLHYADLLREHRFGELLRELRANSQNAGAPGGQLRSFLKFGVWPLMPEALRRPVRTLERKGDSPNWIDSGFIRRSGLVERLERRKTNKSLSFARQEIYDLFHDGWGTHMLELEDRGAAWMGIELRSPFHDRRLIEYAFAIPEEQRCRNGQTKFVLRQAARELIPRTVATRLDKSDFSAEVASGLQFIAQAKFFDSMTVASLGWVNAEALRKILANCLTSSGRMDPWPLWRTFNLELWFNAVFKERNSAAGDLQAQSVLI